MKRILLLVAVAGLIAFAVLRYSGGVAAKNTTIVIPQGSSLSSASKILEREGAVGSADAFLTNARLFGGGEPIKPGEYEIKAGMGSSEILKLLQSGKVLQRFVVLPEGMPSILVYERLMATPLLTGDIEVPPEGSVLPDNYAYVRGEARAKVVGRMQKAMQTALANAWATRKPTTAVTTPEQAIILASIIEKETGRASERRLVAAVYSNRLKRGIPLQADPTTIYPVTRGKPIGRRILRSELDAANGYNTYRMNGLPIGPITNPGKASILAALDPDPSSALFFVAQGDGSSAFADTLDQHNANVEKWRAHRAATGK
jgi:UPF0755 protein